MTLRTDQVPLTPTLGNHAADHRATNIEVNDLRLNKQDSSATLTMFAGLSAAVDRLPYFNGPTSATTTLFTTIARTILAADDAPTVREVLQAQGKAYIHVGTNGDLGRITDGINDYVQINQAIQDAHDAGGGIVQITSHIYLGATGIVPKDKVWLRGLGWLTTTIFGTSDIGLHAIIDATGQTELSPLTDFYMSDLKLDGTDMPRTPINTARKGFHAAYTLRLKVQNVWCYNTPATGFGPDYNREASFENCIAELCGVSSPQQEFGFNGFGFGTNGYSDRTEHIQMVNCYAFNCGDNGFLFEWEFGSGTSRDYQLTNCLAVGCLRGFRSSGTSGITYTSCKAIGSVKEGFYTVTLSNRYPEDITLNGCESRNNGDDGIFFSEDSRLVNMIVIGTRSSGNSGNGIRGGGEGAHYVDNICWNNRDTGIDFHPTSGSTINSITISRNLSFNNGQANTGNPKDGIRVSGGTVAILDADLTYNKCYDSQGTTTQDFGIHVVGAVTADLTGCKAWGGRKSGVLYQIGVVGTYEGIRLNNITVWNNGKAGNMTEDEGVRLDIVDGSTVSGWAVGIRAYDNQGTKTQRYGLALKNTVANFVVRDNDLRGNNVAGLLDARTDTTDTSVRFINNDGFNPQKVYSQGTVTGSPSLNFLNGSTIKFVAGGNLTPTTPLAPAGCRLRLVMTQDGTGSRTISKPSNVKLEGGAFSPTATAGATSSWDLESDGANWLEISRSANLS